MWPKCCPSSSSATWDQDHFTHLHFVSGCRPARFTFKGWPTVLPTPCFFFIFYFFYFILQQEDQLWESTVTGATCFSHTQADISGTSVERGGRLNIHEGQGPISAWCTPPPSLPLLGTHTRTHTHTHNPVTKSCTHKKCKDLFHTSKHILISWLTALIHIKSACSLHTTAELAHTHTHVHTD